MSNHHRLVRVSTSLNFETLLMKILISPLDISVMLKIIVGHLTILIDLCYQ